METHNPLPKDPHPKIWGSRPSNLLLMMRGAFCNSFPYFQHLLWYVDPNFRYPSVSRVGEAVWISRIWLSGLLARHLPFAFLVWTSTHHIHPPHIMYASTPLVLFLLCLAFHTPTPHSTLLLPSPKLSLYNSRIQARCQEFMTGGYIFCDEAGGRIGADSTGANRGFRPSTRKGAGARV